MDINKIIDAMTLEEKASYVSGASSWTTDEVKRLGIPSIFVCDGPHGLRKQDLNHTGQSDIYSSIDAVCFPTASATAASFDRDMMRELGETLGNECQAENVAVVLGPAVNIKRSPLCGRNFEYISEDPYVAGEMSTSYILGVQSRNVGTSIKHFAANNCETERMYASSEVSERALREIYLPAFEKAVKKSQPWTIMASYNRINGIYSSENKWLLQDVLRDEWGFEGFVVSDWGAVSDRVEGIIAGLDLEMPSSGKENDSAIIEAVKNGRLSESRLDKAVENIIKIVEKYIENRIPEIFDREEDHEKAVKAEENSIVLLKNNSETLPLDKNEKILMVGEFAAVPRYQGGGSSHINAHKVVSALSIKDSYGNITYAEGFPADRDEKNIDKFDEVCKKAENADKIVIFAGLPDIFESEGYDRKHLSLPDCQNEMIEKLTELNKPVIVVLHNGAPVEMPWIDKVSAVIEAYLGGEGVGKAVMEILYGNVNPSGKLAESFPIRLSDNPSYLNFPVSMHKVNYAEDVFVGYRYYDTKKIDVLFPFGFGMSYTTFEYSNLRCETYADGSFDIKEGLKVLVDITNSGKREGAEVVQLYVSDKTEKINRPVHELKGFEKIKLNAGETRTVEFNLSARDFQWWNEKESDWCASDGKYNIEIGSSSRDIRLMQNVTLTGSECLIPIIDQDVQIGELLECCKTHDYAVENLTKKISEFTGESADELDEMNRAMIKYMPLRTLKSFVNLKDDELKKIVSDLKELIK